MGCNSCIKKKRSDEWVLSKELAKKVRRLTAVLVALILFWVFTVCAFLTYINNKVNIADDDDTPAFIPEIVIEGVETTDGTIGATRKRNKK